MCVACANILAVYARAQHRVQWEHAKFLSNVFVCLAWHLDITSKIVRLLLRQSGRGRPRLAAIRMQEISILVMIFLFPPALHAHNPYNIYMVPRISAHVFPRIYTRMFPLCTQVILAITIVQFVPIHAHACWFVLGRHEAYEENIHLNSQSISSHKVVCNAVNCLHSPRALKGVGCHGGLPFSFFRC
jgi:hypothetical protein